MSGALAWRVRKALIKINIVFCFGEGRFRGCFFFLFGPDSLLSLWCCCVFSFPFFSFLSSMSCEFFYTLVRVVRAQQHDKELATRQGTYYIVLNVRFNLF